MRLYEATPPHSPAASPTPCPRDMGGGRESASEGWPCAVLATAGVASMGASKLLHCPPLAPRPRRMARALAQPLHNLIRPVAAALAKNQAFPPVARARPAPPRPTSFSWQSVPLWKFLQGPAVRARSQGVVRVSARLAYHLLRHVVAAPAKNHELKIVM